jgi:hypothetical protein
MGGQPKKGRKDEVIEPGESLNVLKRLTHRSRQFGRKGENNEGQMMMSRG